MCSSDLLLGLPPAARHARSRPARSTRPASHPGRTRTSVWSSRGYQAVPYWQDQGHAAYARGYYEPYGLDPVVQGLAKGALLFGGFSLLMGLLDD